MEQVNAKLGKCMATAKGTPVTSEITSMYLGVNVRAGERPSPTEEVSHPAHLLLFHALILKKARS